jgi:hypothetical protein
VKLAPLTSALLILAALAALRLAMAPVVLPLPAAFWVSVGASLVFLVGGLWAVFAGSKHSWTWKAALAGVLFGLILQFGLPALIQAPWMGLVSASLGPAGLIIWSASLGALVGGLIRDYNMLLPISVFLMGFDFFLVLTPAGITQAVLGAAPEMVAQVAYTTPAVRTEVTEAPLQPFALIGPADFLFFSMFLVALNRFGGRAKATFLWVLPALAAYLLIVLLFGHLSLGPFSLAALPALVPMAIVVLAVNWNTFRLSKDEKTSLMVVTILVMALIAGSFWLRFV